MDSQTIWLVEHSEVTAAAVDFVWDYWTDVSHWDDPPAQFQLCGPFVSGSRGTTSYPDGEPVQWHLRDVQPGSAYTIETRQGGACLLCRWFFEALPDGRTTLRQRVGVSGPNAHEHAETMSRIFGPALPAGMKRIAALIAKAAAEESAG